MITIAICDDNLKELDKTKEMCHSYMEAHCGHEIKLITFASPIELEQYISRKERMDILLLDIYMPEMSGIELAYHLRECHDECQIIFLTTSPSHAVEAFSLHAAHYLVKPYTQVQLEDALHMAMTAIGKNKKLHILLKSSQGLHKIFLKDIIYSETDKHIQHLHFADGSSLIIRMTSTELFELLSFDNRFYKCGSTYILNLEKIEEVTPRSILFEDKNQLPMQRRQYRELLDRYTGYVLEGI
ncbi:MAG TPA: LytTR family DNA-binding domain-containing protein [Mobilitalea sp.]|nr:LytTR family DNA-binding domain-containing protein [Mobilitalea sp.]